MGWLKAGPIGLAKRAISYRSIEIARVVQRNLPTIVTATHASGNKIAIPELGLEIDPFKNEDILGALPNLVALKQQQNAEFKILAEGELEIKVAGVSLLAETLQDMLFVHEVFGLRVYAMEFGSNPVVWDIGANIGTSSVFFAGCCGWNVIAYEPFPVTAAAAFRNIERNHLQDRVQLNVAGIGNSTRRMTLVYNHAWRGGNGLFGNTREGVKDEGTKVEIEVRDAAEEFARVKERAGDGLIVAKIDCEGAEYEILRRLRDTGDLDRIAVIVLEVHPIPNEVVEEPLAILLRSGMAIIRHERLGDGLQMIYAARIPKIS